MGDFNAQGLANIAWAFATVGKTDAPLFTALGRAAERCVGDFNVQELANTAWAFAMAGEPTPAPLDPIFVLDLIETQGSKSQEMYYTMLMQGIAANARIEAGFALLTMAEVKGLLSHSVDSCYLMFHTLLEACPLVGDSHCASRVQAAVKQLGLTVFAPMATALLKSSLWLYENKVGGEGAADA